MRETQLDVIIESKLEIIEKYSSAQRPVWLRDVTRLIYEDYKQLRKDILNNRTTWNYFKYCHRFSHHYYSIALLYYTFFQKNKVNLDFIRINIDKCLSKLCGIRSTEREINKTQDLFVKATDFKQAVEKIYIELENKLNNCEDQTRKAKILIHLGHVDYENFDFTNEEISEFKSQVLVVLLTNFISEVEEILTLHEDKDHYSKSDFCRYISRAYQLCGHQNLHDDYMKRATKQIALAFEDLGKEDLSHQVRKEIREVIKTNVSNYENNLVVIFKVIKAKYQIELNGRDCDYVERKFIKYCLQELSKNIHKVLENIAKSNQEKVYMRLLTSLDKVKTIHDFLDYFTTGGIYKLIVDHQYLLTPEQHKKCVLNYKRDIWFTISPKIMAAQKELDVLKQLVIFLRSLDNCRPILSFMQVIDFCNKKISVKKFFKNILKLNLPDNEELVDLKSLTETIKDRENLFFIDKFIELLKRYAFPPDPTIDEDVMTVEGGFISLSEVMPNILYKKTKAIKELRIVGADVLYIDKDLPSSQWAGINIMVVAKTIHVKGKHEWYLSGQNGQNHPTKANDGVQRGEDGKGGKNGCNGQSGGNVYLSCTNIVNSGNLTIITNGGNGGNGQDGGDGAKGEDGIGVKSSNFQSFISPPEPSYGFMKELHILQLKFLHLYDKYLLNTNIFNLTDIIEKLERERNLPNIPIPKIAKEVKIFNITWSEAQFRLNFWDTGPSYFTGQTENQCNITYSYYPHWIPSKQEVFVLYEGTNAKSGGIGGKGGLEGPGGFPGNVEIKCGHPVDITMKQMPGESGKKGDNGKSGSPGKNGWDMGFVFVNRFWSKAIQRTIGSNQNMKLTMRNHYSRKDDDFVYCPYRNKRENCRDFYIEIRSRESRNNIYDQRDTNLNEQEEEKINATRSKAIARNVIAQYENNISNDVIDELTTLALDLEGLKEQALEEIVEEDEEKETENTNFQMQRQAVFDDSALKKQRKVLRKRQKYIVTEYRNLHVEKIFVDPSNIESWRHLKNVVVDLPDLQKLFEVLNKTNSLKKTSSEFSEIYNILLNKYKISICQEIEKIDKTPGIEVYFNLNPIENFLIAGSKQKFHNDDLGTLQDYFRLNDENFLSNLQNYLKTVDAGLILYPLKFFIMEKSYHNPEFQNQSQFVLNKLDDLETRLERLVKSYMVAYETNNTSSMLLATEKRKEQIIKEFENDGGIESIRKEFIKYIKTVGMSSTAVRELLSCAFGVNIKIYIINQNKELVMYHDHNPTSKNVLYLFLVNGNYVEFYIDESYVKLVTERKKLCKNYSDVLAFVNEFVCKKDFDEFFKNFDKFNGYESTNKNYLPYRKISEDDIVLQICSFFSKSDFCEIKPVISKFKSIFIKNKNILMSLLQRFNTEGLHITKYEMMFVTNTILKSYLEKNTNLQMFEWMINVKSQSQWLNELLYIELENHYKMSLKHIAKFVRTVKQKDVLLIMYTKLKEATDFVSVKCVSTCLEVLSEIEVDEETIRSLPLSKWQYILREQLLEYRLYCLVKWESNDQMKKALYYLNCLESNVNSDLINLLLGILDTRKDDITSTMCLDLFSVLHIQEWSLDDKLLEKLSTSDINAIKEKLKQSQQNINEDRSLKTLLKLIKNNSQTSPKIMDVLPAFETHPFLQPIKLENATSKSKIADWAKKFKENIEGLKKKDKKLFIKDHTNEMLMNILNAIKLKKGFVLRTTQRLAMLLMLEQNHNILAQISTGEGKSLIVVAVSIFKALCGEKVDIITSSSVLAIRDATIHKDIYDIFKISVSHNCSEVLSERRDAYSGCPVIFGELSYFQRDYLLDRFHGKNILGDRTYDTLIVDEVDSMLLDKGNNTLYLSHEIPGMDKLESVYQFLWKRICMNVGRKLEDFESSLKKEVLFDLYGTLSIEDLMAYLNISNKDSNNIYIFLKDAKVIDKQNRVLNKISKEDAYKIRNEYKPLVDKLQYIIKRILNRETEIRIPKCLYKFVELHIDTWIKNGLLAIIMEEGIDYVVDVDRTKTKADINPNITIIDKGTGTDQSNSQWEEALHQFLQLKHGCKVSSQSLKAVFISNVSYFQKYNKLFGLTGTLGSKEEKKLLKELYEVQFVNVPTAKPKQFIEQEPLLCCTETDWLFRIVNKTRELTEANRSVLVICETIKEVNMLEKAFIQTNIRKKNIYKREYEECLLAQGKEELDGGSVIIATNLAGRGTDIKITNNLNNNGGLHVLLTYLPSNARIEQQAFGRAARSGCNGSGQLIIIGYGSFLDKREQRETQERQRIADIKMFFDTRIKVEEKFFNNFTKVYAECNKVSMETKKKDISSNRLLDRWAFWIDEYGSKLSENNIDKVFEAFKKDIKDSFSKWKKWTNDPIQLVKIGLNYLNKGSYHEAVSVFDAVIKQEPVFSEAAHYYKAASLAKLLDFEKRPFTGKDKERYNEFILELRTAERLFESHRDSCMMSSAFVDNLKQNMKNSIMTIDAYSTQQRTMITLYELYIRSINDILGHSIQKTSFISQEIKQNESEKIYDDFLDKSILKKSQIVEANPEDIKDLSNSYGISEDSLSNFLQSYENKYIEEQEFLNDFKRHVKIPNLEECWEILVNEKKIVKEKKFIIIDKSKLTTIQENILKKVPQAQVNLFSSKEKHIFMKKYINTDKEDPFIFEENTLKSKISTDLFDLLKKENILVFNRTAELFTKNITQPISSFDSINIEKMMKDEIVEKEAENIFKILTDNKFLKKNANSYVLDNDYNENNIPHVPPYNQTLSQILRINFAYRIALQNVQNELKNPEDQVFVKLKSEPHTNLMWELIEKKIIRPVGVKTHDSDSIDTVLKIYGNNEEQKKSIANNVKRILKQHAGSLQSLETPAFKVVDLIESLNDEPVSPLQELSTFTNNGLEFILKTEEKKYTLAMKIKTFFLTLLAVIEIVAGLAIQLFFAGLLSHVGGWLISEGISDLQYAVDCWRTGYFNWQDYKDYKLQSMKTSLFFACITAGATWGLKYSRFGSKIALPEILAANGKKVVELTGMELIREVGGKAVLKEFSKQFIIKVGEGVSRGLIQEGVDRVVDSYLQNLCNQLANTLVTDIETAVNSQSIGETINQSYRMFGPKEAKEKLAHYTEKFISTATLNNIIIVKSIEVTGLISSFCTDASKRGKKIPYASWLPLVSKGLQYSQYVSHIYDIIDSVRGMLNNVDYEMKNELKDARIKGVKEKTYSEQTVNDFKTEITNQWRIRLQENANNIFTEKIVKPVLRDCSTLLLKEGSKKLWNYGRNTYHKHLFNTAKQQKEKDLQNRELSDEAKRKIIKSYNETLTKLQENVRDPDLYADIVLEKGPMDAICVKAAGNVCNEIKSDNSDPVKLTVNTDTGCTLESCVPGENHQEINVDLNNNHFTSPQDTENDADDYDCLYRAIAGQFPELRNITKDEFRKKISDEIRTNPQIRDDIKKGKHAFTFRKRIYGGNKLHETAIDELSKSLIEISTEELRTGLMEGKYFLSQSSVSEFTTIKAGQPPGIHLSELADKLRDFDRTKPINVVEVPGGKYIFLDNRRIVAASTINNPDVKILARVFKYDEVLPPQLQVQYSTKDEKVTTAGRAAEVRIKRSRSIEKTNCLPYSPDQVRIRPHPNQRFIDGKQKEDFFVKTTEIGYMKYTRQNSMEDIYSKSRGQG